MRNFRWKVPGRSIICDNFFSWIHEIVYCYFVLRFFRKELNDILINGHSHRFSNDLFGGKLTACTLKNREEWETLG